MSIDDKLELKALDDRVKLVEKRLPWRKRVLRRYFSGRTFVAGQVIYEPYGVVKGFILGGGLTKVAPWFALKFPVAAVILSDSWEYVVTFFQGAAAVVSEAS